MSSNSIPQNATTAPPLLPLPPGSTIGILGGGQLGRMLALAAARLGLKAHIYCARQSDNPAFHVAAAHTIADFNDTSALEAFASAVDVVTFEFENVPAQTLAFLAAKIPVFPGQQALEVTQDRLDEKLFLRQQQLPVPPFKEVNTPHDLTDFIDEHGPCILKTRRLGYDGKGQMIVPDPSKAGAAFAHLKGAKVPLIAEALVDFEREISVICVCSGEGEQRFYDICENRHDNGILRETQIPATVTDQTAAQARRITSKIAQALDYIGILTVEMFVADHPEGRQLLVNEIAPRVHNSGHWTLDACPVSQFENHIRAIAGWPLGSTTRHSDCLMRNLIGTEANAWPTLAAEAETALHLYGKTEALSGRKMGHITRLTPKPAPNCE